MDGAKVSPATAPKAPEVKIESVRWLEPARLELERVSFDTVRLTIMDECCYLRVAALRAFPHSHSDAFIQIFALSATGEAEEVLGMIEDLSGISDENRKILAECLEESYLVPRILKVIEIRELRDLFTWVVETDRGEHSFEMERIGENLKLLGEVRVVAKDTQENRYEIPNLNALDEHSQRVLSRYL